MGNRLDTIDIGSKVGGLLCPVRESGKLAPHLTQRFLGRGLPPYQVAYSAGQ